MSTRETFSADAHHAGESDETKVVVTLPTEDAAERFIYLLHQLAELRGSTVMRLLSVSAALKRYTDLATRIEKQPGAQPAETKAKKLTLEDLNLTDEEMQRFAEGARFLFGDSNEDRGDTAR